MKNGEKTKETNTCEEHFQCLRLLLSEFSFPSIGVVVARRSPIVALKAYNARRGVVDGDVGAVTDVVDVVIVVDVESSVVVTLRNNTISNDKSRINEYGIITYVGILYAIRKID
jgi:hypothetical protein